MSKIAYGAVMIAVGVVLNGGMALLMVLNGELGRALAQFATAIGLVIGGVVLRQTGRTAQTEARVGSNAE